jgi:hypothetical protein
MTLACKAIDKPGRSAKTDIDMVLIYIYYILIVKVGQAGKGITMQDIPGEWFVKLSQDLYSYGINIYISHIYCRRRTGWERLGNARRTW